jgi:hypothetical protein
MVGCRPKLTKCSHLFCGDCLTKWFSMHQSNQSWAGRMQAAGAVPCPVCKEPLRAESDLHEINAEGQGGSLLLWKMLAATKVKCANHPACNPCGQCDWVGDYGSYQQHARTCRNCPTLPMDRPATPTALLEVAYAAGEEVKDTSEAVAINSDSEQETEVPASEEEEDQEASSAVATFMGMAEGIDSEPEEVSSANVDGLLGMLEMGQHAESNSPSFGASPETPGLAMSAALVMPPPPPQGPAAHVERAVRNQPRQQKAFGSDSGLAATRDHQAALIAMQAAQAQWQAAQYQAQWQAAARMVQWQHYNQAKMAYAGRVAQWQMAQAQAQWQAASASQRAASQRAASTSQMAQAQAAWAAQHAASRAR